MVNLDERIKLIKDIKKFTIKRLGIIPNSSFETFEDTATFFAIYASKKDKVESVLGEWGNEFFKDEGECLERKSELDLDGFDTLQMTWEAHGSKDCPITPAMLKGSKNRLTYLVMHENWHVHCRERKINFDLAVEEAIGDTIAYQGALLYWQDNPQMVGHIIRDFNEWQKFYAFSSEYLQKLEEAYRFHPKQAKKVLASAKREAKKLSGHVISKEVKQRLLLPINNAFFLRMGYYAPMAVPVYNALKDMDPRDYITNRRKLSKVLKGIV